MTAHFNQILIVDSIPANDTNTAQRLADDLTDWCAAIGDAPKPVRITISSADRFQALMRHCTEQAAREPYVPLLHIECHGSNEGLQFADGSQMTWADLEPVLTALNEATRLNLLVVVAACFGSDIANTVRLHERAPFWGFLAPKEEITAAGLEEGFSAFYQTLVTTRSAEAALGALRDSRAGSLFMYLSVMTLYRLGVEAYFAKFGTNQAISDTAHRLQRRLEERGVHLSLAELEAQVRDPVVLDGFRRKFFMADLYPDHAERFA